MKLYMVTTLEYSGFDCGGHVIRHLAYANSVEEASKLIPNENDYDDHIYKVEEYKLPEVGRKRKGFIIF